MSWWTWPALRGAVLEQIPGRLVDIGAGGCSLETTTRLSSGTFGFVEIQGTAEGEPFARETMNQMLDLAAKGIGEISVIQQQALAV